MLVMIEKVLIYFKFSIIEFSFFISGHIKSQLIFYFFIHYNFKRKSKR
jgi:hypothetical protein